MRVTISILSLWFNSDLTAGGNIPSGYVYSGVGRPPSQDGPNFGFSWGTTAKNPTLARARQAGSARSAPQTAVVRPIRSNRQMTSSTALTPEMARAQHLAQERFLVETSLQDAASAAGAPVSLSLYYIVLACDNYERR